MPILNWRRLSTLHKCAISTATFALFAFAINLAFRSNVRQQITHTRNLLEHFNKATLKTLDTDKEFSANELWIDSPVVLLAVRRPG